MNMSSSKLTSKHVLKIDIHFMEIYLDIVSLASFIT
jgi:hypothetical protein